MNLIKMLAVSCFTFVVACVGLLSNESKADATTYYFQLYPAAMCNLVTQNGVAQGTPDLSGGHYGNLSTSNSLYLMCPLPANQSSIQTNGVTLWGLNGPLTLSAEVCSQGGTGTLSCPGLSSLSTAGNFALSLPTTSYNPWALNYLWVQIPSVNNGTESMIYGYAQSLSVQ